MLRVAVLLCTLGSQEAGSQLAFAAAAPDRTDPATLRHPRTCRKPSLRRGALKVPARAQFKKPVLPTVQEPQTLSSAGLPT